MARTLEELQEIAEQHKRNGRYEEAIEAYHAVLKQDPEQEEAYYKLAELFAIRGLSQQMVGQYLNLLGVLEKKGELNGACEVCKWIIALEPSNTKARIKLIELLKKRNATQDIIKHSLTLSKVYTTLGQGEQAIALIHQIQELKPNDLELTLHLGELYIRQGQIQEGIAVYKQIAAEYVNQNQLSRAVDILKRIKTIKFDDLNNLYALGVALFKLQRYEEAEAEFRLILRRDLSHIDALTQLGLIAKEQENYTKAELPFKKITDLDPSNATAKECLGEIYEALGDQVRAIRNYLGAGELYGSKGEKENAIEVYQNILALDLEHSVAKKQLAALSAAATPKKRVVSSFQAKRIKGSPIKPRTEEIAGSIPSAIVRKETSISSISAMPETPKIELEPAVNIPSSLVMQNQNEPTYGIKEKKLVLKNFAKPGVSEKPLLAQEGQPPASGTLNRKWQGITSGGSAAAQENLPGLIKNRGEGASLSKPGILSKSAGATSLSKPGILKKTETEISIKPQLVRIRSAEPPQEALPPYKDDEKEISISKQEIVGKEESPSIKEPFVTVADSVVSEELLEDLKEAPRAQPFIETIDKAIIEEKNIEIIKGQKGLLQEEHIKEVLLKEELLQEELSQEKISQEKPLEIVADAVSLGEQIETLVETQVEIEEAKEPVPSIKEALDVSTLLGSQEWHKAIMLLSQQLQKEPENTNIRLQYAFILKECGFLDEAFQELQRVISDEPSNLAARESLWELSLFLNMDARAEEEGLAIAGIYDAAGNEERKLEALGRIISLNSANVQARRELIKYYLRSKQNSIASNHYQILVSSLEENCQYLELIELYRELLKDNPQDTDMLYKLANAYEKTEKLDESRNTYLVLASTYEAKEQWIDSVEIYQKLISLFPMELVLHEHLRDLFERLGERESIFKEDLTIARIKEEEGALDDAIARYEAMVRDNPDRVEILDLLWQVYVKKGLIDRAVIAARTLLPLLLNVGNIERAIEIYQTLTSLQPGEINFHRVLCELYGKNRQDVLVVKEQMVLGHLYANNARFDEAIVAYSEAIRRDPSLMDARYQLGVIYADHKGSFEEALLEFQRVCDAKPNHAPALRRLTTGYMKAGDGERAMFYAKRLMELDPNNMALLEEMLLDQRAILDKEPVNSTAILNLGIIYRELGKIELAIEQFQKARKFKDTFLKASNCLGLCFQEKALLEHNPSMLKIAIQQFEKGLQAKGFKEDEYLELHYNLGCLYERIGEIKEAIAKYREVFAIDIKYKDVNERIIRVEEEESSSKVLRISQAKREQSS